MANGRGGGTVSKGLDSPIRRLLITFLLAFDYRKLLGFTPLSYHGVSKRALQR
jgi:hypothetical protein